mmetsp:Transcript_78637/g.248538  ORF Transcript_78637/g.248538 Transcript_78637/m.248538 type:complete len:88 (+) Transcript_78637:2-265(+)
MGALPAWDCRWSVCAASVGKACCCSVLAPAVSCRLFSHFSERFFFSSVPAEYSIAERTGFTAPEGAPRWTLAGRTRVRLHPLCLQGC